MNLTGGIVLYAVLWFVVLFVLLPLGQRSQADMGEVTPGTPPGAPHAPALGRKMAWATAISAAIWGAAAWVILSGAVTYDDVVTWDRYFRP